MQRVIYCLYALILLFGPGVAGGRAFSCFRVEHSVLLEYGCEHRKVTIPDFVTRIGAGSLANKKLTELIIPNSVTHIDNYAVARNSLEMVIIPDSVVYIGINAFLPE